jgi:two-component system, OmpR family, KDP operon response regulator KdpE
VTTVLIVDDDPSLLELLTGYLGRLGYRVAGVSDPWQAGRVFADVSPDIVLLDVSMPGLDGWQVLSSLRVVSLVPVIMLTARGDEHDVLRGFASGADDYVTKPFSFAQLGARIKAVLDRAAHEPTASAGVLSGEDLEVDVERHRVLRRGVPVGLTATEFRILVTLMREPGRVLSPRQIVTAVWGPQYAHETGYIRRYVWHLRQKLEEDPGRPRYIFNERNVGYFFPTARKPGSEATTRGVEPVTANSVDRVRGGKRPP